MYVGQVTFSKVPENICHVYLVTLYIKQFYLQGNQLNMTVCFWYLVTRDLFNVRYYTVAYTSVAYYKVPKQHGHVVH